MIIRKIKDLVHFLPKLGCITTGALYAGIGLIALLSFFKVRDGGADESSMLVLLDDFIVGKILIVFILSGTASYVGWRIYEVCADPYHYGGAFRGIMRRTGIALSTIADLLVVSSCVRVLLGRTEIQGNGQPVEERHLTKSLLDAGEGWLVILIGGCIVVTAFVQLLYGVTRGYKERMQDHQFNSWAKTVFHVLALYGYGARGTILFIVGFFFLKAGVLHDSDAVVNTDKAFDFIGDHIGGAAFIIVAMGTIAYGCFMFALGITYKPTSAKQMNA